MQKLDHGLIEFLAGFNFLNDQRFMSEETQFTGKLRTASPTNTTKKKIAMPTLLFLTLVQDAPEKMVSVIK
jgi:hypothetical protein